MKIKKVFTYLICSILICILIGSKINTVNALVTDTSNDDGSNSPTYITEEGNVSTVAEHSISYGLSDLENNKVVQFLTYCVRWIIIQFIKFVSALFALIGAAPGTSDYYPQVADIVFNTIPFFDPNFINPATVYNESDYYTGAAGGYVAEGDREKTFIGVISDVVAPIYSTSVTLGVGLFGVIALIIGIKLALSFNAEDKAKYKTAIAIWITGIVLLFIGQFLMSLVFYVNEQIVSNLYTASRRVDINVFLPVRRELSEEENRKVVDTLSEEIMKQGSKPPISMLGYNTITLQAQMQAVKAVEDKFACVLTSEKGFQGLFDAHLLKAAQGDLTSTIILGILAGQTFSLIILYIKRLMYCIILGLLYPFVIIADTFKKVISNKGGYFESWFGQFCGNVMMQSIHAIIFIFACTALSNLYKVGGGITTGQQIIDMYSTTVNGADLDTGGIDPNEQYLNIVPVTWSEEEIDQVVKGGKLAGIIAIIEVCIIASFTKVDEFVKNFLEVGKGPAGTVKESAGMGLSSMAFMYGAAKSLGDNFSGTVGGAKNVMRYNKQIKNQEDKIRRIKVDTLEDGIPIVETSSAPSQEATTTTNTQVSSGGTAQTEATPQEVANAVFQASGKSNNEINNIVQSIDRIYSLLQANSMNTRSSNGASYGGGLGGTSTATGATVSNGGQVTRKPGENEPITQEANNDASTNIPAPNTSNKKSQKYNNTLEDALDKKSDIQAMRNEAIGQLGSKSAALMATLPLAIAGTAIGTGAESEKLGASIIMAGDKIAETVGKMAVKTPMVTINTTEKVYNKIVENPKRKQAAQNKGTDKNVDDV